MVIPVVIAAARAGLHLRPTLTMPPRYGRRALSLGGAGLGAVGAQQLVLGLVLVLSMKAGGTGTLPVFQYAQALYLLPYAILVVPLVTAVFPHLSELRLVGDTKGFANVAGASVRTVMVVAVIGGATLFAGASSSSSGSSTARAPRVSARPQQPSPWGWPDSPSPSSAPGSSRPRSAPVMRSWWAPWAGSSPLC